MFKTNLVSGTDLSELWGSPRHPGGTRSPLCGMCLLTSFLKLPFGSLSNPPAQFFCFDLPSRQPSCAKSCLRIQVGCLSSPPWKMSPFVPSLVGLLLFPKPQPSALRPQADFQPPFGRRCDPALGVVSGSHCHFT